MQISFKNPQLSGLLKWFYLFCLIWKLYSVNSLSQQRNFYLH